MFFTLSEYIGSKYFKSKNELTTYSVIIGLVLYGGCYLYVLFRNKELLPFLNQISFYIVGLDLLLATFLFSNIELSLSGKESYSDNSSLEVNDYTLSETSQSDSDESEMNTQFFLQNLGFTSVPNPQIEEMQSKEPIVPVESVEEQDISSDDNPIEDTLSPLDSIVEQEQEEEEDLEDLDKLNLEMGLVGDTQIEKEQLVKKRGRKKVFVENLSKLVV
jgi:hypothetical protein